MAVEKEKNIEALDYLKDTFNNISETEEYAKSGNMGLDSILNYKIQTAKNQEIDVALILQIPEKLNIRPFDMVTIIGNLLDNAIEATSKLVEDRKIDINIKYDRNILYVSIRNPFKGELAFVKSSFKTKKDDEEKHGFGLESIRKTIEKYNGAMNISHENNLFIVNILLYNTI